MSFENAQLLAGFSIPQTDAVVKITSISTCDSIPIRTYRYATEVPRMSRDSDQVSTRCDIPKAYSPILASTCQRFPIRTERYASDKTRMSLESVQVFSGFHIPQTESMIPTPACKCFPIRTE